MNKQKYYKVADAFYRDTIPIPRSQIVAEPYTPIKDQSNNMDVQYSTSSYSNTADPRVWGPAFWLSLHNGASKYPVNASAPTRQGMKGFILGIPYMVPCDKCAEHARAHIEANYKNLDDIVSGKDKLFEFFWTFHQYVNNRYNKVGLTLQEAWIKYTNGANVTSINYQ